MSIYTERNMSGSGVLPATLGETYRHMLQFWDQDATMMTVGEWEMPPLSAEIVEQLERLTSKPANWDGNGIVALDPITVERTRYVLELAFLFGGTVLPVPFISPTRDGRMILEWETEPGRELIIDVPESPERHIRFLLVEPNKEGEETEIESEISDTWSIQGIVRRLMASPRTERTTDPVAMGGSNRMSGS